MTNEFEAGEPLGTAKIGDATIRHQLHLPSLNDDGTIHLSPEDGSNIAAFPVEHVMHKYSTLTPSDDLVQMARDMGREERAGMMAAAELLVTDARVIVHSFDDRVPGEQEVGHLWYPWISLIEFHPKQSFLNDSVVNLRYDEDFPGQPDGGWFHRLEFTFTKSFHPGNVAFELVRRLAAHHLRMNPPAEAREKLIALTEPPILPDPPKGDFATYRPPIHVTYPYGVPYVDTGAELPWEWIIHED